MVANTEDAGEKKEAEASTGDKIKGLIPLTGSKKTQLIAAQEEQTVELKFKIPQSAADLTGLPDDANIPFSRVANRIRVKIFQRGLNSDYVLLKQKRITWTTKAFKYKGQGFIVAFRNRQWEKKGIVYQLILNYDINISTPIGFQTPDAYADAALVGEFIRRKLFQSLLNKADMMLQILAIVGIVAAVAITIHNMILQGEIGARDKKIVGLEAENAKLNEVLGKVTAATGTTPTPTTR